MIVAMLVVIHANIYGLETVLGGAETQTAEHLIVSGYLVSYQY